MDAVKSDNQDANQTFDNHDGQPQKVHNQDGRRQKSTTQMTANSLFHMANPYDCSRVNYETTESIYVEYFTNSA